ncbi:hypothetical protein [Flavobacterium sp.]|uniref:hypothetical protein n=1 Tax=Flavobacterium sp. TaxID=239 RepID=UPI0026227E30|nr:hypothetical protein [Flavobacterium sp.]
MGFGFNLLFILVILPLSAVALMIWLFTRNKKWLKTMGAIWFFIVLAVFLVSLLQFVSSKTVPGIDDIRGKYVVDRRFFPGKQADWQYDHFRFEITDDDQFLFYVIEKDQILKTYRGAITYSDTYTPPRIALHFKQPTHHIIADNPTLYREVWSFYYVFHSEKFNNMYFKKGDWEPRD